MPRLKGRRTTWAPRSAAMPAVRSIEPSSTTTTSKPGSNARISSMTRPTVASSFRAGTIAMRLSSASLPSNATGAVWLPAQTLQLAREPRDAVGPVDADPAERVEVTRSRDAVVRRRRAEIAGAPHRRDHVCVVAPGRIAEEVDGGVEHPLQLDARAVYFSPALRVADARQVGLRGRVRVALPA